MSIPFGITYLAAVLLKHNHNVILFDIYPDDDIDEVIKDIDSTFTPDLIGFSVLSTNFYLTKTVIEQMKRHFRYALYCAGGIHPTVRPVESITQLGLDFVIIGEGENVLIKVCDAISNNKALTGLKGVAFKNGNDFYINNQIDIVQNLDSLPFPARELLPVSRYLVPPGYIRSHFLHRVMSVFTSRGCPAKCTFCNSSSIFHKRVRRRSVKNVINEIEYLQDRYRIDGLYFHDETLTLNHRWIAEMCREMKRLNLKWGCQTRVNLVNDDLLRLMKSSGCLQIDYGIESASKRMLKSLKKGITPDQSKKALELTKKHGIKSFASFMIGLPDETEADIYENFKFLKVTKPDFTYFNLYTPFPGTEATEKAIEEGRLSKHFFSRDYDMLIETTPLINLSAIPTDKIIRFHKRLRNEVFLTNYLGVLSLHNMTFILEAIFYFITSWGTLFDSIKEFIKKRNIEKFIFRIFSNYQKRKITTTTTNM